MAKYCPGQAFGPVAAEGGGVDRDDAGGALSHSIQVQQFFIRKPALLLYQLPLEEGQHGIAAAEGAGADPGKGGEEFQITSHNTPFCLERKKDGGSPSFLGCWDQVQRSRITWA